MSKPDDVSQEAWDTVEGLPIHSDGFCDDEDLATIARAIMAAKDEERKACAHIADSYIDPIDIAHHIRKRGVAK